MSIIELCQRNRYNKYKILQEIFFQSRQLKSRHFFAGIIFCIVCLKNLFFNLNNYKGRIQIFLKLIGSLGSPCDCNLIGEAPCAFV
jgi:hypothetical protein